MLFFQFRSTRKTVLHQWDIYQAANTSSAACAELAKSEKLVLDEDVILSARDMLQQLKENYLNDEPIDLHGIPA